jgi:hypothetical protein
LKSRSWVMARSRRAFLFWIYAAGGRCAIRNQHPMMFTYLSTAGV